MSKKDSKVSKITLHDAAKHVGVQPRTLNVYHQKGKQVKSKAAMLLSKHNVAKEEEQSKAEPCPKPEIKAEPCPKPPQNPSPMKVKLESPQEMDNRQVSIYTISDDDLLSSHSCDVLNSSMVSSALSFGDEANEYEEFPPTQLSEKGDVFASLAEGVNEYRDAAFAAPPGEEGVAHNQVFEDMSNPFTAAKKPKKAPCRPKVEPSVCYMCDEPIPRRRDTIALQPVSCDACRATYHLRCAKLTRVPRHGSWICESCTMTP